MPKKPNKIDNYYREILTFIDSGKSIEDAAKHFKCDSNLSYFSDLVRNGRLIDSINEYNDKNGSGGVKQAAIKYNVTAAAIYSWIRSPEKKNNDRMNTTRNRINRFL